MGPTTRALALPILRSSLWQTSKVRALRGFIRFAETHDWQSLKSDASWCTSPVHSELLRQGFGDFVGAMRERGAERLFPAVNVLTLNNAGGAPGKWFSSLKSAMSFGSGNTFYGWRNTLETKLQLQREGQLFIDRYAVDHKPADGAGPETYARIRPADLVATARKITDPGLNLLRVFTAQCSTFTTPGGLRRRPPDIRLSSRRIAADST